MYKRVGFSGTRLGMTDAQIRGVRRLLSSWVQFNPTFIHGACIGADEQALEIAKELNFRTIAYPSNIEKYRTKVSSDEEFHPMPPLSRNVLIATSCDILIATPKESAPIIRSGTWATIRYANGRNKPIIIIYPEGEVERFSLGE